MKNPLKEKLARGELVASMTVRLVSGIEIVPIAKFGFVVDQSFPGVYWKHPP